MSTAERDGALVCQTCPRRCRLAPDALGACRARRNAGGTIVADNYGRVTSLAPDPMEKKPLARYRPGTLVVSVGSYGCNLTCPFCQNWEISQAGEKDVRWRTVMPDELVAATLDARRSRAHRAHGVARGA